APSEGGATPSMVPLSLEGTDLSAGFGPPAAGAVPPGRRTPCGAFIISIVPLNLGAAAPFMLKPHFLQVFELSSFSVPQLGQNTISPPFLSHADKGVKGTRAAVEFTSSVAVHGANVDTMIATDQTIRERPMLTLCEAVSAARLGGSQAGEHPARQPHAVCLRASGQGRDERGP